MTISTLPSAPLVTDDPATFNTKAFAFCAALATLITEINAAIALNNITAAADVHAATSKTTLVDADELPGLNSATSFTLIRATWANIKATLIATAMTWTGVQKFTSGVLKILGSSTGTTAIASANASATDYTVTLPAKTGTVVLSTDLGTGIATALAINAGTTGAPILQGGAAAVSTLSASGNTALGTTANTGWAGASAWKVVDFLGGSIGGSSSSDPRLMGNLYYDGSSYRTRVDSGGTMMLFGNESYTWFTAPSGGALGASTITQRMALSTAGLAVAGSVFLGSYTVATVPSAATAGATIFVSNAGGNGPCIAVANGSVWKRCDNTSTTVS